MAGDWIKMRSSLITNPKVNGIARFLEANNDVTKVLTTGAKGNMSEYVTRNVMRNVTVATLLTLWGAANEHTNDGMFKNADLQDIDDIAGIPHFAEAMMLVGWLKFDEKEMTIILPNFVEYNTCGKDRAKEKAAERQKRYRERQKKNNAKSNVTSNVTSNGREEKRREYIKENNKKKKPNFKPPLTSQVKKYCTEKKLNVDAESFIDFYQSKNWMVGKTKMKDWQASCRNWARNDFGNKKQNEADLEKWA